MTVVSPYGGRFEAEIDLNKLRKQDLNKENLNENYEFDLEYPVSKLKTTAKLLCGRDEKKIRRITKSQPGSIMSYLHLIRTVSLQDQKHLKVDLFREMDSLDTEYFREEYDKRDCGYDTMVLLTDPQTLNEFEYNIKFDEGFFLGLTKKKTKKLVRM